jgi:hypothetical protein
MKTSTRNAAGIAGVLTLIALLVAALVPGSAGAITITKWQAGTCAASGCSYEGSPAEFFAQAAGHPNYGVTEFEVAPQNVEAGKQAHRVKVELPEGLNVNPLAVPQCSVEAFQADACSADSKLGVSKVVSTLVPILPIEAAVYNLVPNPGEPALFGFHAKLELLPGVGVSEFVYLETAIEWAGDYHESFFINNIQATPAALQSNRLTFEGTAGGFGGPGSGSFLTLPSPCNGNSTSILEVESGDGEIAGPLPTTPPVPIANCGAVPFAPNVTAAASGPTDSSSTITVSLNIPQHQGAKEINTSTVKSANVALPVGAGLNPATAPGLKFCPDNAFPLHSKAR